MSAGRSFFDTNILMYVYSDADARKQQQARHLYQEQVRAGSVLISTQVIQEFYAAASRKLAMPRAAVHTVVEGLCELPLVVITPAHIRSAMGNEQRYQISFWDALILAAAEAGGAEVLYTEDLNDGQQYGAVVVRNPFRPPADAPPVNI